MFFILNTQLHCKCLWTMIGPWHVKELHTSSKSRQCIGELMDSNPTGPSTMVYALNWPKSTGQHLATSVLTATICYPILPCIINQLFMLLFLISLFMFNMVLLSLAMKTSTTVHEQVNQAGPYINDNCFYKK